MLARLEREVASLLDQLRAFDADTIDVRHASQFSPGSTVAIDVMPYPEPFIAPMRAELTSVGVRNCARRMMSTRPCTRRGP